jgi:hypothetical protein
MKGRVIEPVVGNYYYLMDIMADDGVLGPFRFAGDPFDYDAQNKRLFYHDKETCNQIYESVREHISQITKP